MPQKGRPSRNRYRNTSDLSSGVQRANVSGNVPQQNLKRREALFCWARRRFAPAKCRNALLLSSKSVKLSFSREKLLTHYHEPTHISHQWTCESVSGSHLREAKRRGENTTHPLDPDKLTKMEPRVPSLHCNLKREQNPAFLVSGGSSYYPLCSTPRSRGAAPR